MLTMLLSLYTAAARPPAPDPAISAVVTTFARAAETRDVAALRATLDPAAVQYVRMNNEWSALPTEVYLGLMSEGKIGGDPVAVEILTIDRQGSDGFVSTVRARRTTPTFRFDDTLVLVRSSGGWVIVSAAVVVTPAAP